MIWFLVKLFVRVLVFGVAIVYVTRRNEKVKIQPRAAVPLVALTFAALNTALYWLLSPVLNLVTLGMVFFAVPFAVNAAFLHLTTRIVKPFKIDGLGALLYSSLIVTVAHVVLKVVDWIL